MKNLIIFFFVICVFPVAYADSARSPEIDAALTAQAPWKVGDTIPNSKKELNLRDEINVSCKFLGILKNDNYWVQELDQDGNKSTELFEIIIDDELKKSGFVCSDQKIEGVFTRWYLGGETVAQELTYRNGLKDGNTIIWDWNGKKEAQGNYKNGLMDGVWSFWYGTGKLFSQDGYRDGVENGAWLAWYRNGEKKLEGHYINGLKDGFWLEWYENGQKKIEGFYRNGEKEGLWQEWDEEGNLLQKQNLVDGVLQGEWYSTNGYTNEIDRGYYVDGKKEGIWEKHYLNGRLRSKGKYVNDKREGEWVFHTDDYEYIPLIITGQYKDGEGVGIWRIYDEETGKIMHEYKAGEFVIKEGEEGFYFEAFKALRE